MRKRLTDILNQSVERAINSGALKTKNIPLLIVEIPRDETKGDFATTVAMTLAPMEKAPPRSIAEVIVNNIEDKENLIDRIEIAGPGYINFFLKKDYWVNTLKNAVSMGDAYGNADIGGGKSVQVEFLSANPTGPLHIGHGRVAAFGDTLANLLMTAGYNVQKEYYINDVGNQMETLGRSTYIRYKQLFKPDTPFIEDGYKGDYIKDIAQEIAEDAKDRYMHLPEEDAITFFVEYSKDNILEGIKKDLEDFGVLYDNWFSEKSLHDNGEVDGVLKTLKEKDYLYESDGAQWLRTTLFGDDKDRVVVDEVGKDAARFMFLTRRSDSHLDFDLEVVKKESSENPVYYVEYAHARIVNIFKQAAARGIQAPPLEGVDLSILSLHEEIKMMKLIASYPELIEASALSLETPRITFYLLDLATALHNYYFHHRVITDDMQLTNARLILMQGIMHVLRNALAILGIRAPESM